MRLLLTVLVFVGTYLALSFVSIGIVSLLDGSPWTLMILIYPQLGGAAAIAVIFAHRWKRRPLDPPQRNGNVPS